MKKNLYEMSAIILTLAMLVGACNLPTIIINPAATSTPPGGSSPTAGGESVTPPAPIPSEMPPLAFATLTQSYTTYPGELSTILSAVKDDIFPSNYGDNYATNLYERPFQLDNTYRPDADIAAAYVSMDSTWYYFSTEVVDINPATKTLDTPFGYEIDFDRDGRGDFLLWATPPFSANWTNSGVQVYADLNRDVGNRRPILSDAPITVKSDGYETVAVYNGAGRDPEAAWARQSPNSSTTLQIAVKKSLINQNLFLWWAWTDFDLGKPAVFDYNDTFTAQEAGSPYSSSPYYPLKALFGMDNTCRAAFGFTPVGNEPGLCGAAQPTSAPTSAVITVTNAVKTAIPVNNPTGIPVLPKKPTDTPTPEPAQKGSINGIVFIDNNGNWAFDTGDEGTNAYELRLYQNNTCTGSPYLGAAPATDGNYNLTNLPAGYWCLQLLYTGSPVKPLNPAAFRVNAGAATTINFAIEPPG